MKRTIQRGAALRGPIEQRAGKGGVAWFFWAVLVPVGLVERVGAVWVASEFATVERAILARKTKAAAVAALLRYLRGKPVTV